MRRAAGRILDALSSVMVYGRARLAMLLSLIFGFVPALLVYGGLARFGEVPFAVHVMIAVCGVVWAFACAASNDDVMGEVWVLGYAAPFAVLLVGVAGSIDPTRREFWLGLGVPLVVAVLSATLGGLLAQATPARRAAARRSQGRCPSCGYDLRASPERCPECGTAKPGAAWRRFGDT